MKFITGKYKNTLTEVCMVLLILLFVYAASSKLMNYEQSRMQMMKQLLPAGTAPVLTWLVPVTELLIAVLLFIKRTRLCGFYAAAFLMTVFSVYIAVAMSGWFGQRPCSCGGVIRYLNYWQHLVFNLVFVGVGIVGAGVARGCKNIHLAN